MNVPYNLHKSFAFLWLDRNGFCGYSIWLANQKKEKVMSGYRLEALDYMPLFSSRFHDHWIHAQIIFDKGIAKEEEKT